MGMEYSNSTGKYILSCCCCFCNRGNTTLHALLYGITMGPVATSALYLVWVTAGSN